MAKITFGKQSDESKFTLNVLTHGTSFTEIGAGDQTGHSVRDVHITDLPEGIDMVRLARDLARIRASAAGKTEVNLKRAEEAVKAGDEAAAKAFLAKAGAWGLDLAKSVGADVAVAAIKASLGIA